MPMAPRIPAWVADYVGLPYRPRGRDRAGVDCYGLVWLVLSEQYGVQLPAYDDAYRSTERLHARQLAAIVQGELPEWTEVPLASEAAGDCLLIRSAGEPIHVAVVVAPGWMLHVQRAGAAVIEDYQRPKWAPRLLPRPYGPYRYRAGTAAVV